jgi:hypothetical protein
LSSCADPQSSFYPTLANPEIEDFFPHEFMQIWNSVLHAGPARQRAMRLQGVCGYVRTGAFRAKPCAGIAWGN